MPEHCKLPECDIILKGGVTSGIVYPKAIKSLSENYRFINIGGTSAGAIGAVLTAAAEYRRQKSKNKDGLEGFDLLEKTSGEFKNNNLTSLFQPDKDLAYLFNIILKVLEGGQDEKQKADEEKSGHYSKFVETASKPLKLLILLWQALPVPDWKVTAVTLMFFLLFLFFEVHTLSILILVGFPIFHFLKNIKSVLTDITETLPTNDYGFCSGLTTSTDKSKDGVTSPAITDWLHNNIQKIAGRQPDSSQPLTVGDLVSENIHVACMTTDLTSRRPYRLPLDSDLYYFRKSDIQKLLPESVVTFLTTGKDYIQARSPNNVTEFYFPVPKVDDMPLVMMARLSLSFPGLIKAFPLYRYQSTTNLKDNEPDNLHRCLFSDGGISSNFPIHFFDSLIPRRPTFGISLASSDVIHDQSADHEKDNINLNPRIGKHSENKINLPIYPITGLGGFLGSIFNTARGWQESLQSALPGYAERIVTIELDKGEGGLNIDMPESTITKLENLGLEAGNLLAEIDYDDHRHLRAVSAFPAIAKALSVFSDNYHAPVVNGGLTYDQILTQYDSPYYQNENHWRNSTLAPFARDLADMGKKYDDPNPQGKSFRYKNLPRVEASLRIVANADKT